MFVCYCIVKIYLVPVICQALNWIVEHILNLILNNAQPCFKTTLLHGVIATQKLKFIRQIQVSLRLDSYALQTVKKEVSLLIKNVAQVFADLIFKSSLYAFISPACPPPAFLLRLGLCFISDQTLNIFRHNSLPYPSSFQRTHATECVKFRSCRLQVYIFVFH